VALAHTAGTSETSKNHGVQISYKQKDAKATTFIGSSHWMLQNKAL